MKKQRLIEDIIDRTATFINHQTSLGEINTGLQFEDYVTKIMDDIGKTYNISVEQTGEQSFPDIIIGNTYGVEVKFTKGNKWESTGNSIFEGTFRQEVTDQIFVLFGKKDEERIRVRFDEYQNCISDIKVTHSPRFMINMDDHDQTVFDVIGMDYHQFRQLEPNEKAGKAKEYFRSKLKDGEEVWWVDVTRGEVINPTIKEYRTLNQNEKQQLIVKSMAFFPEIFSNQQTKYLRFSVYLLKEYQLVSSSLRDLYSAGGRDKLKMNEKTYNLSQIYVKLYRFAPEIKYEIESCDLETLVEHWERYGDLLQDLTEGNRTEIWKRILDSEAVLNEDIEASDIFELGLLKGDD